ncbi:hypothetical protein [Prauserella cavernicola]|uniref:Uncharacterized protein n=1 Tax=Prauserella cavernicola TaxID=2800127 RepID=A0A934V498_9PSEU|nr:hypothetical protein [Prauserella cavernicola]MBK1784494.1 hypothetical protein [Prauserella cavernicola]
MASSWPEDAERSVLAVATKIGMDDAVKGVLDELRAQSTVDSAATATAVSDLAVALVEAVGDLDRPDFLFDAVVAAARILAEFVDSAAEVLAPGLEDARLPV